MKKFITFATAASLILGSMSVTAYGATFADIDTVTWSGFKPFLEEAGELGLMSGHEENGKRYCKPRDNVTYCETVQLMYSAMRVYTKQSVSDATVTKWTQVMSAYNIPTWFYPATAFALENEILTTAELSKLRGNTQKAPREDVAVIFGRALDTLDGYDIKSNPSLSYADKSQVSAAALPYVELLNRAGLMVGDTDNKFTPKANITRAEMAVLSVKTYNKLQESGSVVAPASDTVTASVTSAMMMSNGDLFLSMKTSSGAGLNLFAAKGEVEPEYEGQEIAFTDISAGDKVKVTYEGQYIEELEVTYSKYGIQKTVTYELVKLTDSKITVLDEDEDEVEYRLFSGVDVTLEGRDSTIKKLQNAMEDAKYDAILTLNEDDRVTKIKAVMNDNNPTEGTLTDVEDDTITIQAGSKEYTYPLAEGSISIKQDGKSMTFSRLKNDYDEYNYVVSLKMNDDHEVTGITIEDYEDETKGTLTFLNSRRITITAAGEEFTYDIEEDDVEVKIDGRKKDLDDLKEAFNDDEKAFTVELEVDRYDQATSIVATSKTASGSEGELVKVTSSEITIEVDNKDITYRFASDVDIEINGKNRTVDDLKDSYESYQYVVELEFNSSEKVTKVVATMEEPADGVLKDIVESAETITVTAGSVDVKLELASSASLTLDGKSITLKKLNDELDYTTSDEKITVELTYNSSGKVTKVKASWEEEKPTEGELYSVDTKDDIITLKDDDGKKHEYEVKSSVDVTFKLASSVRKGDYKATSSYADSLAGLDNFLDDCDDAGDDCYVELTIGSGGKVTAIKATAE